MAAELHAVSRWTLYVLLTLIGLLSCIVAWAQIGCLRGKPFKNPDGTTDDWREQKLFYGIAWADLVFACPLSAAGVVVTFIAPELGLFILAGASVWFVWASIMTTVTSLRFEKPRITFSWFVVFPFGSLVGLAYLVWILVHFEVIYG